MSWRIERISQPSVEPVTLADAKLYLRVEITDDDALISSLITAARCLIEERIGVSLITQTWILYHDTTPMGGGYYNRLIRQQGPGPGWLPSFAGSIVLPRPPIQEVLAVQYWDRSLTLQSMGLDALQVSLGTPGRVQPKFGTIWPVIAPQNDAIQITYKAGFGDTADAVPEQAKLAMKLLIGDWYLQREATAPGSLTELPFAVSALLASISPGSYT